ncbi:MAG: glycogen synthase [Verrucomicrobiota bacterium]
MRILFVTPELAPWSKAGGLGDATAALGKALGALGHEVRAVTPLYGSVPGRERMGTLIESLKVGVGGDPRKAACRVRTLPVSAGFEAWFIEHEDFYGAREIYPGREDAGERAAFYGRAALDACLTTSWLPEVVHCHDWTAGLVPALLNTTLKTSPLGGARSVITIHNLQHQGVHPRRLMDYLGLPAHLWSPQELECLGGVNFLKGGILHAAQVITVSPTYAKEILTPAFGYGLDEVVRRRAGALRGILNGVDRDEWNPTIDKHLAKAFSTAKPAGKAECKTALLRELDLPTDDGLPLVGVISRLWEQKGLDLAAAALPRFLREQKLRFVLLGSGDAALENEYRRLAADFPRHCAVRIGYDNGLSHRIEAGSDFFLMPSRFEPCGLNQMYSMAYGTLPIVRATGGLADTVTGWDGKEQGTGIVFEHADQTAIEWGLRRALDLYAQPKAMKSLRKRAMLADFSWMKAAEAHLRCYQAA